MEILTKNGNFSEKRKCCPDNKNFGQNFVSQKLESKILSKMEIMAKYLSKVKIFVKS